MESSSIHSFVCMGNPRRGMIDVSGTVRQKIPPIAISQKRAQQTEKNASPFNPTLFLLKLSILFLNSVSSGPDSPETPGNSSNSTGTFALSKMSLTEFVISFPTPSPGMRVTLYTPPYCVCTRGAALCRGVDSPRVVAVRLFGMES